jgi:carbon-monoxide dehydrogenase large subunit
VTLRLEDGPLLEGRGRYLADLPGPTLHAAFVRSPIAHGRLLAVDTTLARTAPGVVAVLTAPDLGLAPIRGHPMLGEHLTRPPLAHDEVRFLGEPLAVVVADSPVRAVDAAERVLVDVEPLPVVRFGDDDAPVVWELATGDEEEVLAGAAAVVRGRFVNQRVAAAPMEPDGALAAPDGEGVEVWASTQRVHTVRDAIAAALGIDAALVRVRAPHVGGGFGGKFEPTAEAVVVAALAHHLGRPVRWVQTRQENLTGMPHGRGQVQHGALAVDADGMFLGIWADLLGDAGAYPMVGALIPNATLTVLAGTYRFARAAGRARSVATNTTPVGAYRGAGRPEAAALLERLVDLAAVELGTDPVELRRRNLVRTFPHRSPTGVTYDAADYRACLDAAVTRIGYDAVRAEQAGRRARGDPLLLGVGVAMWLDCTPMNRPAEWASLTLTAVDDGVRLVVRDGANDQGQAHATTWAILVSERLRLPLESVTLELGDTFHVPYGEGTGSARSTMLAGGAVVGAADELLDRAKRAAAGLLEADPSDIVLSEAGHFAVAGVPVVAVSWAEIARAQTLAVEHEYSQSGPTFPAGCHAAVVEVDAETGAVRLVRFVAVDDCGTVVNPVVVAGQQQGGIVQGVAQALWEEIVYDDSGNLLTSTFADYAVPSAAELPPIEVATVPGATPVNALGAKGIGRAGAIGSTIAVQNAVVDALTHLGVRHVDLPCTPERIWRAIVDARQAGMGPGMAG